MTCLDTARAPVIALQVTVFYLCAPCIRIEQMLVMSMNEVANQYVRLLIVVETIFI